MKLFQASKQEIVFKNSSRSKLRRLPCTSKVKEKFVLISGFRMPREQSINKYLMLSTRQSKRTTKPLRNNTSFKQESAYFSPPFKQSKKRKKHDDLSLTTFIVKKLSFNKPNEQEEAPLAVYSKYKRQYKRLQRSIAVIAMQSNTDYNTRYVSYKESAKRPKTSVIHKRSINNSIENVIGRITKSNIKTSKRLVVYPPTPLNFTKSYMEKFYVGSKVDESKNVIVFQFDGVIGDFDNSLYLRANACATLKSLQRHFRIVLVFRCIKSKAKLVLEYLTNYDIDPESAYIITKNPWSRLPVNYTQIYSDCNITNKELTNKLIIIGSYDCEELNFIDPPYKYNEVLSSVPIILTNDMYNTIPVIILIRNILMAKKVMPLSVIGQVILKFGRYSKGWSEGYKKVGGRNWSLIETHAIHQEYVKQSELIKEISNKRTREKCVDKDNNLVLSSNDPLVNIKYMQLLICNDNIREQIKKYKESESDYKDNSPILEVDTTHIVSHKLVIIKENPEKTQSYNYVENLHKLL